jgi:glycosyltransferase involved in cell wall biosynthesis
LTPRPFISVLIDTFNHERFIAEAVESVLEQDVPEADREIVVVDDGSTDGTAKIVRNYAPRVRLLEKKNGGQASAFNVGIPECRGQIVAFLDGDDWWAPGKLSAVADTMAQDSSVGLIGHGITEVYSDGRRHTELLREIPRFRITSPEGARAFRLRKSFLGTSRMTFRADILQKIGKVPEALTFEADEYLFTLAGLFTEVMILRESFTFYRLHDSNAFVIANGNPEAIRRKQKVLTALAEALQEQFRRHGLPEEIARIVLEWVENEADMQRLLADSGTPWETVRTELRNYRVTHENASVMHWTFKCLALLPACVLPARMYYSLRHQFAASDAYRKARGKWLPYLQPQHVDRYWSSRP